MDIDFELLKTLVDIGNTRSFTAAAKRRHLSPSAVSQRIRLLEQRLGFPLFSRAGRQNRLTPEGQRLFEAAHRSLTPLEEAVAALRGDSSRVGGPVRIGCPVAFGRLWLRPRLVALRRRYPELLPEVQYDSSGSLGPRLVAGEFDLCILVGPVARSAGLASRLIYTEEFLAVGAPDYLKRRGAPRTLAAFSEHPFIVFDQELAMLRPWWRAHFGPRAALPPRHACRVASLDEILALTEAGIGLTVLPNFFIEDSLARGAVALVPPDPPRSGHARRALYPIYLCWRRSALETARLRAVRELFLE
ncbi:MAG: LysR family transcriptional regulator [Myxococcales bacterium]